MTRWPREIIIRISFGDVLDAVAVVTCAVFRYRSLGMISRWWRTERSRRRAGKWEPFTFGDWVTSLRRRRWFAQSPRRTPRPWWSHGRRSAGS